VNQWAILLALMLAGCSAQSTYDERMDRKQQYEQEWTAFNHAADRCRDAGGVPIVNRSYSTRRAPRQWEWICGNWRW